MTRKGVWNLQQVRDKYLQSLWANDMNLFAWGYGFNGTRGDNSGGSPSGNTSSPVQIGTDANWSSVSGKIAYYSEYFRLQTKTDGTLWAWGRNAKGELGQNNLTNYSSPTQIPGTTWTSSLTVGYYNASCVKTDGTLWTWGQGYYGILGLNDMVKYSSPTQIPGTTWSKAYLGSRSSGGVKTDGTLWMWGSNAYGELGQNSHLNSPAWVGMSSPVQVPGTTWSTVHVGEKNVAAIKTDGTLWSWGNNAQGQLGQNNTTKYSSPVQIPGTDWSDVWTNISNTAAIKTDGTLWVWGWDGDGKLGNNTKDVNQSSPIQIPGTTWKQFTWVNYGGWQAVKTDGTLWTNGRANYGQGGHEYSGDRSSPTQISSDATWDSVGSWAYGTVGLKGSLAPSQL